MKLSRRRPILLLLVIAVPASVIAAWMLLFPLHHDPPITFGDEIGSGGSSRRKIVCEYSYRVTGIFPGPHGWSSNRVGSCRYFLEVASKPRQELLFLPAAIPTQVVNPNLCQPVQNTSWWIVAGYFNPGPQIEVVVFDPNGIRIQRTIAVSPDLHNAGHDFWLENGNHTLKFRSAGGVSAYDVMTDSISDQ